MATSVPPRTPLVPPRASLLGRFRNVVGSDAPHRNHYRHHHAPPPRPVHEPKRGVKYVAQKDQIGGLLSENIKPHTNIAEFCESYSWSALEAITKRDHLRAGLVIIIEEPGLEARVLFVQGKNVTGKKKTAFLGPPKGMKEDGELSAIDTAVREAREEIGFDVRDVPGCRLMKAPLMSNRSDERINEMIMYFIVSITSVPPIKLQDSEIESKAEIPISTLHTWPKNHFSLPTQEIIAVLQEYTFDRNDGYLFEIDRTPSTDWLIYDMAADLTASWSYASTLGYSAEYDDCVRSVRFNDLNTSTGSFSSLYSDLAKSTEHLRVALA